MLGKILKYDLKWIFKEALYLYPILLGDVLLIACLPDDGYSEFISFLRGFAEGAFAGFIAVFFVTTLKLAWVRMTRSMYSDEAYLTRTLPTSFGTIFTAKVLAGIILLCTNVTFCLLAATIAYPDMWGMVAEFADLISTPGIVAVLAFAIVFLMQSLFVMMSGFLGITIGYRFRNQHFAWSAVFTSVIYIVGSGLLVAIEFLIGLLFDKNLLYFFDVRAVSGSEFISDPIRALQGFVIIAAVGYAVYNICCYVAGRAIQKRGTDID